MLGGKSHKRVEALGLWPPGVSHSYFTSPPSASRNSQNCQLLVPISFCPKSSHLCGTGFSYLSKFQGDGLPYDLNSMMTPRKAIDFSVCLAFSCSRNGGDEFQSFHLSELNSCFCFYKLTALMILLKHKPE